LPDAKRALWKSRSEGRFSGLAALVLLLLVRTPATAQAAPWIMLMGQGIPSTTSVNPVPGGGSLTEVRLVQPVLMLQAAALADHLTFTGTANLEGLTIPNGELLPGGWGEGFYDRRHPHTYAHELLVTGQDLLRGTGLPLRLSLSAGKGFAPFGSDDPMSRPVFRYPVNHHLAQILERAVGIVGIRAGPVVLEGGLFNGDEPTGPGSWPRLSRFGDSWSARLTLLPAAGLELSASRAKVHSPESPSGAGPDDWKWHAAARLDRRVLGGRLYALTEWARTSEANGFFVLRSLLAEASFDVGGHRPYYRFEQSDRPEDERTTDPFRAVRPHLENSIVGITRFTLHTLGYGYGWPAARGRLEIRPFVEGTLGHMRSVGGGIFQPGVFYGKSSLASVALGVRLSWRMAGHRMGRYGRLLDEEAMPAMSGPMEM